MQSQNKSNHRAMMGCLIINGKRYPLYEGINTIGRCITATVSLKSLDVSKQHAIITIINDNEHYLSDFQSFNGTFLKKSKLVPLALYKISKDSVIEFGNVTATYNKIPNNIIRYNHLDEFHSTQFATQSLYDANTQAIENEITHSNSTVHVDQLDSYFDDDYSFDEINSQMINERNEGESPVFKVPTINDIPTQKLCGNSNAENVLNIHELETQKIDDVVNPINTNNIETQLMHETTRSEISLINDMPTQISIATNHIDIHDLQTQKLDEASLSIHNVETQKIDVTSEVEADNHLFDEVSSQKLCANEDVPPAVNYIDIHTVETQNLDITSADEELNVSTINDVPTQIIITYPEQNNSALIFDETVLDISEDKDTRSSINITSITPGIARDTPTSQEKIILKSMKKVGVIEADMEADVVDPQVSVKTISTTSESKCHTPTSQDEVIFKPRKKIGVIESDSEMDVCDSKNSENVIATTLGSKCNSESSQDEITFKQRKKICVIESDSEMDVGSAQNSEKVIGTTLGSKCNSETSQDEIIFKSKRKISIIESDTETDVEDIDVPVETSGTILRSDSNKQISQVSRFPVLNNRLLESLDIPKDGSGSDTDEEILKNIVNDKSAVLNSSVSNSHVLNRQEIDSGSDTDIEGLDVTVKKPSQIFSIPISKALILDRVNITAGGTESDSDTDDFVFNTQVNNSATNPKIDDSCNDEIIPGTQFLEEDILNDNPGLDDTRGDENTDGKQVVNSIDDMESLYLEATQSIRAQNSHTFSEPTHSALQNTTYSGEESSICEELKTINQPQVVSTLEHEKLARSQQSVSNETLSKEKDSQVQDSVLLQGAQPVLDEVRVPAVEDNIFDQPTQQMYSSQDVFMQPTQALDFKNITKRRNMPTQKLQLESNIDTEEAVFLEPTQPIVKFNSQLHLNDEVFLQPTQPLQVIEEKTDFKQPPPVNKNRENISNVEVDDVYMEATQPSLGIVTGINAEREIEKRLENMFASQSVVKSHVINEVESVVKSPVLNEVESQLEVVFDSQNVSYRAHVSHRPGNPLLNEFEDIKNVDSQSSENSSVTVCNETSEASNVRPSRVHNAEIKESCLSKDVTIPRKFRLSLRKSSKDNEDDYLDECQGPSKALSKGVENSKMSKVSETNKKHQNVENNVNEGTSVQDFPPEEIEVELSQPKRITRSSSKVTKKRSARTKSNNPSDQFGSNSSESTSVADYNSKKRSLRNRNTDENGSTAQNKTKDTELKYEITDKNITTKTSSKRSVKIHTLENENQQKNTRSKKEELKNSHTKSTSEGPSDVDLENINLPNNNLKPPEPENVPVDVVRNRKINPSGSKHEKLYTLEDENQQKATRSKKNEVKKSQTKNTSEEPHCTPSDVDFENTNPPEPENVPVVLRNRKINPSNSKHEKSSGFDNAQELLDKSKNINLDIGQGTNKRKSNDEIQETDPPEKEITNKRARKVNFLELPSTSSRSTRSKRAVDGALETPKKRSKAKTDAETPTELSLDTCSADISTPDRNRRKQKPKVVFTMLDSPELESIIRSLGGTVVNSVETSTVLVTGNLKRTPKLLSAVGLSKPICSPKWLQECKKACQFLDPWDYVLEDVDAERNWNLSLKESLIKSRTQKLFQNCTVYIAVTNSIDALKAAVESCGGKCVTKAPGRITNQNFVIVANPENKSKYSKFLNRDPPIRVVKPEAILDGVLRQELRFEEYLLS